MPDASISTSLSNLTQQLSELGLHPRATATNVPLSGCACDSRDVHVNDLFVCKGQAFTPTYLHAALAAGASAYLCNQDLAEQLAHEAPDTPALVLPNSELRQAMAHASRLTWGDPDLALPVFGITGTKGKSSAVYLARAILARNHPVGIMGSIGTYDGVEDFESHNTTPEAPELWRHLHNAVVSNLAGTVMEVSSQALKYDRTLGLRFAAGVFLNIGRDHISPVEHPNFEDYFASKLHLFGQSRIGIVNLGTEHLQEVLRAAQSSQELLCLSAEGNAPACGVTPHYWASDVRSHHGNVRFVCHTPQWTDEVELGMPGLFNVENALAAVAIAQLAGASQDDVVQGLPEARVPGRMELIGGEEDHIVGLVDYAHNRLSYQKLFSSLKQEFPEHRIIALFGAPGNKAQERRVELPEEASKWADDIILTEEDPIHEDPADICNEMAEHVADGVFCAVEPDRAAAIRLAVKRAAEDDRPALVCLLAKGDETRQHVGDEYLPMVPDGEVFKQALADVATAGA